MQKLHPFICDARIFTNSRRGCSNPHVARYEPRAVIALVASGASLG
jgi:hypothetical protein